MPNKEIWGSPEWLAVFKLFFQFFQEKLFTLFDSQPTFCVRFPPSSHPNQNVVELHLYFLRPPGDSSGKRAEVRATKSSHVKFNVYFFLRNIFLSKEIVDVRIPCAPEVLL